MSGDKSSVCFVDAASTLQEARVALECFREATGVTKAVGFDLEWHTSDEARDSADPGRAARVCLVQLALFCDSAALLEQVASLLRLKGCPAVENLPDGTRVGVLSIVFDALELRPTDVGAVLRPLFEDARVLKLAWAVKEDAMMLNVAFGVDKVRPLVDIQLLALASKRMPRANSEFVPLVPGLRRALEDAGFHELLVAKEGVNASGGAVFAQRPLASGSLEYAVADVCVLYHLYLHFARKVRGAFRGAEAQRRIADVQEGSAALVDYHRRVPYKARQNGFLPLGILKTVAMHPSPAATCETCRRDVAATGAVQCWMCAKASTWVSRDQKRLEADQKQTATAGA